MVGWIWNDTADKPQKFSKDTNKKKANDLPELKIIINSKIFCYKQMPKYTMPGPVAIFPKFLDNLVLFVLGQTNKQAKCKYQIMTAGGVICQFNRIQFNKKNRNLISFFFNNIYIYI